MEFVRKRHIPRALYIKRGFAGYSPRVGLKDSQWFRESNLSTRAYPYLRPRSPRRRVAEGNIQGIGYMDGLCILKDNVLTYGETSQALPLTQGKKELISFGSYLIVCPDMVWVNTADHSTGFCEVKKEFTASLALSWCDREGEPLETVVDGDTAPENTAQFWLDTSCEPYVLREYSQELGKWRQVQAPCIRLTGEELGVLFPKGSQVLFEDCPPVAPYVGTGLCTVLASGRDYLAVEGTIDAIRKEMGTVQLKLRSPMPLMDHLISHENRLWGCRYGKDHDGKFVNEIYASALGDFTSWYSFQGIASDSYVLSLGAEGPFTGAAVVGGYPVFFKENSLHKLYGTDPGSYRLQSTGCVGIAPGSSKSAVLLDNTLVYLGRDGFYRYDGSLPRKISQDLEGQVYSCGIAGTLGSLYYVSVKEGKKEEDVILTYDGEKNLWHRETGCKITAFCNAGGILYYTAQEPGLFAIGTEEGSPIDNPVLWEATTGLIRRQEDKEGHFTALRLGLSMEPGSSLSLFADYDSRGVWIPLGQVGAVGLGSREIPLRIRRCDHFRLKLQGRGDMTLYNLRIEMEG